MPHLEPVTFKSNVGKQVYRYVERHGPASLDALQRAIGLSADELQAELDRLETNGHIEREGETVDIALDLGERRTYHTEDFEFAVRPAREDDYDGLVDVVEEVAAQKTYVVAEALVGQLRYDETVIRLSTTESRVFFVATADGEIIGWSHLDLPLTERLRPTAQLTVGVTAAYRGNGVGTHLMERALEWAETNGYLRVYNHLARTNVQAISFLRKRGWEEEGVRSDHYTIGPNQVDQVMMTYSF